MSEANCCAGSGANALIFSCSDAADVGEIADRAARKLTRDRAVKMFCLAGVGGLVASVTRCSRPIFPRRRKRAEFLSTSVPRVSALAMIGQNLDHAATIDPTVAASLDHQLQLGSQR